MQKWAWLIAAAIVSSTATPIHALDPSSSVGTMVVEFQPIQSAGIKEGCTLVYRVVGRDYANGKGKLITLDGNIAYMANRQRDNVTLSFKVGIGDTLDIKQKTAPPFFAYLQTPNGTTAGSKVVQFDSDTPGFRIFAYQLEGNVMKVYGDIINGTAITIGFNRRKGGLDLLVPLDLKVAEATIAADGSITRRRSDEMLLQFQDCVIEVTGQVQNQLKTQ